MHLIPILLALLASQFQFVEDPTPIPAVKLAPIPEPSAFKDVQAEAPKAVIADEFGETHKDEYPLGEMLVFTFDKSIYAGTPGSIRSIIEPPDRAAKSYLHKDGLSVCVPTGLKPVTIKCTLIVTKGDIVDFTDVRVKCGNGDIPPPVPPGPGPHPDPSPDPPKPVKHLQLVVIEDTVNRSPEAAVVMNSIAMWNELRQSGHDYIFYDRKTLETKGKKYVLEAGNSNLFFHTPYILIRDLDADSKLVVVPLPKTPSEVRDLVKKWSK